MRNTLLIARREYMEQIRGRGFRMSTIGLPVLFAVILFIAYTANKGVGSHKHYIVASTDPAIAGAVRDQLVNSKKIRDPRRHRRSHRARRDGHNQSPRSNQVR